MAKTDSETAGGRRDSLPAGVIEELLASPARVALLEWLHTREGPAPVDDAAIQLATRESGEPVSDSERRAARSEIYQEHLPKLTATGVVRFDSLLGQVELNDVPALVARLDRTTAATEDGTKDK